MLIDTLKEKKGFTENERIIADYIMEHGDHQYKDGAE